MLEGYVIANCICPSCKTEHQQMLTKEQFNNPDSWHIGDKFYIVCKDCKDRLGMDKQIDDD